MGIRFTTGVVAGAFALAACGHRHDASAGEGVSDNHVAANSSAGGNTAQANGAAALSPAQAFANAAAASDAFEISSSQLAASSGSAKGVKSFAQRMIDAHTTSSAKLKTVGSTLSPPVVPDAKLTPDQQKQLDDLKSKNGPAFDSAYLDDQIAAHQAALNLLRTYATSGDSQPLKDVAGKLIPTVTAHLNAAKAMKH